MDPASAPAPTPPPVHDGEHRFLDDLRRRAILILSNRKQRPFVVAAALLCAILIIGGGWYFLRPPDIDVLEIESKPVEIVYRSLAGFDPKIWSMSDRRMRGRSCACFATMAAPLRLVNRSPLSAPQLSKRKLTQAARASVRRALSSRERG